MTRRAVAVTAWLVVATMNALWVWAIVGGGFLGYMYGRMAADRQQITPEYMAVTYVSMAGIVLVTLSYATVGLLLASRPGGGRMGAILLLCSALFTAVPFGYAFGGVLVLHDPRDPIASVLFLLGPAMAPLGYASILPIVALVFPDGRLPSSRWRWPTGATLAVLVAATVIRLVTPGDIENVGAVNPLGFDALPASISGLYGPLAVLGSILISALGTAAVVARYRRGQGVERQQLRWFLCAVLLAVAPLASSSSGGGGPGAFLIAAFGLLLVPVSVGIAVTRYRLYEIDRLISRGLSWAVLSGLLLAVYSGAVLLLQTVLGGVTQGQTVAVAGSTLLAAALFQPLRRRVQSAVDHRFNRARYDAERTATDFAERLRDEMDIEYLSTDLATTAGSAVHPAGVGVWLRPTPGTTR